MLPLLVCSACLFCSTTCHSISHAPFTCLFCSTTCHSISHPPFNLLFCSTTCHSISHPPFNLSVLNYLSSSSLCLVCVLFNYLSFLMLPLTCCSVQLLVTPFLMLPLACLFCSTTCHSISHAPFNLSVLFNYLSLHLSLHFSCSLSHAPFNLSVLFNYLSLHFSCSL